MKEESDLEIENILETKTKRKKSGQKGKRGEREICDCLNSRFEDIFKSHPDWGRFSRSVGSGNRWGQNVFLSRSAKNTYGGDITCPDNFRFVIESKCGYNEIDLNSCFATGNKTIDGFLNQVEEDSKRSDKKPILIWKKDRKPKLVFLRQEDMPLDGIDYFLKYRGWIAVDLETILSFEDNFFFNFQ